MNNSTQKNEKSIRISFLNSYHEPLGSKINHCFHINIQQPATSYCLSYSNQTEKKYNQTNNIRSQHKKKSLMPNDSIHHKNQIKNKQQKKRKKRK
jgi:hypothetical protein